MPMKTILVLANSIKKSPARCIAGREITADGQVGPWIRPVCPDAEGQEGELSPSRHCRLQGGGMPAVLDVVQVPIAHKRDDPGQPENWEVRSGAEWVRMTEIARSRLAELEESPGNLWLDGGGSDARISVDAQTATPGAPSLTLVRPTNFRVCTWSEYNNYAGYEQKKTRGCFRYRGHDYDFSITDDRFTDRYCTEYGKTRTEVRPPFGDDCLLCISLGAPFKGYHYKLIATVLPLR